MTKLTWEPMRLSDLPTVNAIADRVHLDYPEDPAVFAERLDKAPFGCFVLKEGSTAHGYIISHPWLYKKPPELNTLLGELSAKADTYYIHDIALLPEARGGGHAGQITEQLVSVARARGIDNLSLVAVNNSVPFWTKSGFTVVDDPALAQKLLSYDEDARFMVRKITA